MLANKMREFIIVCTHEKKGKKITMCIDAIVHDEFFIKTFDGLLSVSFVALFHRHTSHTHSYTVSRSCTPRVRLAFQPQSINSIRYDLLSFYLPKTPIESGINFWHHRSQSHTTKSNCVFFSQSSSSSSPFSSSKSGTHDQSQMSHIFLSSNIEI